MREQTEILRRIYAVAAACLLFAPVTISPLAAGELHFHAPNSQYGPGFNSQNDIHSAPELGNLLLANAMVSDTGQPIKLVDVANDQAVEGHDHSAVTPASAQTYLPGYEWELAPAGLMFHSYLAGEKEPRFASFWATNDTGEKFWDASLGGRWGIVRYGTPGPISPQGFQLDFEGAALARVLPEEESTALQAVDFRVGIVGTWHIDRWRAKVGYYHLSAHLGDEYMQLNPTLMRINYVRDAALVGLMYDLTRELQIYGEAAYAFNANDGAEPGEFQFGAQFSKPDATGPRGFPFIAVNEHWRQEFGGELSTSIMAGWMWRGRNSDNILRVGFQHYNGPSLQYQLFDQYENLNGFGIWYDF